MLLSPLSSALHAIERCDRALQVHLTLSRVPIASEPQHHGIATLGTGTVASPHY